MPASSLTSKKNKAAAIDWRAVKKRLEAARIAVEQVWAPTAAETKRILKARAQVLAREHMQATSADELIEVVEFQLASEIYAVESRYIREVHPLESLTPLPCTPAFVRGSVNVHGEILSVIDIKKFFDLPEQGIADLHKIIVLQSGGMVFGILADVIIGVRTIPLLEIQPSLPTLTGIREEYLRGITAGRTVILDAAKLLLDEKMVVNEQVGR
ncbi:MAG TPA: chemotaxis protein CheW [Methylophilaceae bacterium]